MRKKVGIVDYNIGNLFSIKNIIKYIGARVYITNDPQILEDSNLIILPGVGSFKTAIDSIRNNNLDKFLVDMANKNKTMLGICLGMQLFARTSFEGGVHSGLNIFPFDVVPLFDLKTHIGWNTVTLKQSKDYMSSYFNKDFYFNHTYGYLENQFTTGITTFDSCRFSSMFRYKNIFGCQFHPEKSQKAGIELLNSLLKD